LRTNGEMSSGPLASFVSATVMIMIIILDRQHANADIHPKIAIKIAGLYS